MRGLCINEVAQVNRELMGLSEELSSASSRVTELTDQLKAMEQQCNKLQSVSQERDSL